MEKTAFTFALIFLLAASSFQPLGAQDINLNDQAVYFDAKRLKDGRLEIKFVLSKSPTADRTLSSSQSYSIIPDPQQNTCGTQATADRSISQESMKTPLYDFADKEKQLPVAKLPVFFATIVSAELARKGLAKTEAESLPYHTCTRLLWKKLLQQ